MFVFVRKLLLDEYIVYFEKSIFYPVFYLLFYSRPPYTLYAGVFAFLSELFNGCELVFIWLHPS